MTIQDPKRAIHLSAILVDLNFADRESICDAHRAIFHAELDLSQDFGPSRDYDSGESHDFDNYDILDETLESDFMVKLARLLKWCAENGIAVL